MTREDIIRMAREAGPLISTPFNVWCERFAALVAAAEREACAKVCETIVVSKHTFDASLAPAELVFSGCVAASKDCAAAIRARGEK